MDTSGTHKVSLRWLWVIPIAFLVVLNLLTALVSWIFRKLGEGCGYLTDLCEIQRGSLGDMQRLKEEAEKAKDMLKRII
jgi:hypothetical protein